MTGPTQPIDLGILLALAFQNFARELRVSLAESGFDDLGRSDGYVFRALSARAMTISHLAAWLDITKQGAGQIVDDMQRRGYVARRADPDDGRARLVELTARGTAAFAAARSFHARYERRLVRKHGKAAVTDLREILGAMAGPVGEVLDPQLRALHL